MAVALRPSDVSTAECCAVSFTVGAIIKGRLHVLALAISVFFSIQTWLHYDAFIYLNCLAMSCRVFVFLANIAFWMLRFRLLDV